MSRKTRSWIARFYSDENGQILPWMVMMSVVVLGAAGITIDLGHAFACYRQLQASTDAAALAGANALSAGNSTQASVTSAIDLYAATANGANASGNLPSPTISIAFSCVSDAPAFVAAPCSAAGAGYNVVRVTQTATVPTYFIRVLTLMGINSAKSLTLTSTASATMASGANDQVNVAIVVDATASMNSTDTAANCGKTRIYCALQGVRTMLGLLAPCTAATSSSSKTCVPYDQVSLFTFPTIASTTASLSADSDCSTSTSPNIIPYTTPTPGAPWSAPTGGAGTYQVTGYLSDWSTTNSANGTLSNTSTLVNASGGPTGSCAGLDSVGGDGTYYAGAIYAAQSSLMAAQVAAPGSRNIMIILSDGDANAASGKMQTTSGTTTTNVGHNGDTYPSLDDQCQQAITAAQYASTQKTTVYTIAYGASKSGCSSDTGSYAISPCQALMEMSTGYTSPSNAPDFYSDSTASSSPGSCIAPSTPDLSLKGIFGNISAQLTKPRLIPNSVT